MKIHYEVVSTGSRNKGGAGSFEYTWTKCFGLRISFPKDDPQYTPMFRTVAFTSDGEVIGFHEHFIKGNRLKSNLTYVKAAWRKLGVARDLWNISLGDSRVQEVQVWIQTKKGGRLIDSLRELYPSLVWRVEYI